MRVWPLREAMRNAMRSPATRSVSSDGSRSSNGMTIASMKPGTCSCDTVTIRVSRSTRRTNPRAWWWVAHADAVRAARITSPGRTYVGWGQTRV